MITPIDAFVPLAASSSTQGKGDEFRVLVAPRPEKARPLRDLNPAAAVPLVDASHRTCEPRVTLQRDGPCITGIQIHCSCGQVVSLKCAYAEEPAVPKPA